MLFRLLSTILIFLVCKDGLASGTSPPVPEKCDLKTINFHKAALTVEPDKNFQVDQILGSWYVHRWYLPLGMTVSDHHESYSSYNFIKAGYPNVVFSNRYRRDKLEHCCLDLDQWNMTEISNGVYTTTTAGNLGEFRTTFVYTSSQFMVEANCLGESEQSCANYDVTFWSRCKKPRPQDVAKGEHILRKLCYPHMKRFVCQDHYEVDCHEPSSGPILSWPNIYARKMSAADVLATRKQINVLDSYMSYLDTGGDKQVVIFLHGNPTSSYLWRNVIPEVSSVARCVAPDLIGFGKSGKNPTNSYLLLDHYRYLSAWIDLMNFPGKVHLVLHDWGSGLGFHWANNNRNRVRSITFMEGLPFPMPAWENWPEEKRTYFHFLRSPAGEEMMLKQNVFIEQVIPQSVMRNLTEEEMDAYREPFLTEESRKPILELLRQVPIKNDGPEDTLAFSTSYHEWLKNSKDLPKLYIHVEPGLLSVFTKKVESWPNTKTITVKGLHFVQEDSPVEIGKAVREFLLKL